jgi:hypothetical protein
MNHIKALACSAALAGILASIVPVQAEDGRNAAAIGGLAAGALLGGAIAGGRPAYDPGPGYGYRGPRRVYQEDYAPACHIERQAVVNSWGEVVRYRRVRVCD